MPASKTSMPPFPALRAFHAAARHGRFRDAARELAVTESAISHQVRRLEDFLRVQLFDRNGPRVRLTSAGARYFADVDPAMARIAEATRVLMGPVERQRVALTLPPSLAILWLIPNLGGFEQACPGIDLQLVTTTRLCDLRREQIDLAIRYGRGPWPDVEAEFLLGETATPVCRPGYLELEPAVGVTTVLKSCRLIVNGYHPDEWSEWAGAHGAEAPTLEGAFLLESQDQVLAAAEQGLGLAMGRRPQVDERLKSGVLVAPFGTLDPSDTGYHLCRTLGNTPTAGTRQVARWLADFARDQLPPAGG
jgi:LysR family glycine cleavage system transcriptional activator